MPRPSFDPRDLRQSLGDTVESRFQLGARITEGPTTELIAARDLELGRIVAVKRVRPDAPETEARRIIVEAQVAAQLTHPNVVPLYSLEVGADGRPNFTMQRVRGETLARHIERCAEARDPQDGPYSLRRRLEIFLGVCDAIAYAHSQGVYHRKLLPSSVMLGPFAEVFVMDWGSAGLGSGASPVELTVPPPSLSGGLTSELIAGVVPQAAPDTAAERRDRHALALLLGELVTLAPRAGTDPALPSASRSRRRAPRELSAIVEAALDVAGIYPDVRALAEDVRRYMRGESPAAWPATRATLLWRKVTRNQAPLVAGLTLLVAALVGFMLVRRAQQLDAAAMLGSQHVALAKVSGAVTRRADRLDATMLEVSTELHGTRAALGATRTSTMVDEALRALVRRTSALRAYLVTDGAARVVGLPATDLSTLTPRGVTAVRWEDPRKRTNNEPWVVPVIAELRRPTGGSDGVIGIDIPLATLTVHTSMPSADGLQSLAIVDSRGRGVDAQGFLVLPPDRALTAAIESGVGSTILLRGDRATVLARLHELGWYLVGVGVEHP